MIDRVDSVWSREYQLPGVVISSNYITETTVQ